MTILTPTPHSPSSLTLTTATPTLLTHYTPSPPGFVNASGIYTPDSGMDDGDGLVRASVKIVAGAIGSVAKWGVGKLLGWPAAPSSPLQPPSDDSGCPDDSGSPAPPPPTPPLHLLPTISPPPLPPSSHILHLSASPTSPHFIVLSSPPRLLIYHLPPPLPPLTHPAPHLTGYLKLPLPPPPTTVTWLTSSTVFLGSPAGGVVVDVTTVRILQNVKFDEPVDRIIHYNGALVGANKAQSTLIYPAIHTPAPPALPSAAAQEFRQLLTLSPTSPDSVARLIRTIETSCVDLQSCLMFLNILPKIESDEIALKVIDAVAQTLPTLQATVSTETAEKVEKLLKHAETQRTVWRLICETTEEYPHSPANSPDPSPPPSSASEVAQYLQLLSSLSPPPAIPPRPLSLQTTVNSLLLSPHPSLTTSTPLRLRFLTSLYEPLLASLFAVKTVQETLAATGLDAKNVQTSLAEFVLALSTANLNALESSGINKLTSLLSLGSPPGPLRRLEPFLAVILACSRPAACLALACLAMDAVKRAAATREQKTLGLELAANETDVWSDMIERVRTWAAVSARLSLRLTLQEFESKDMYAYIARDEISCFHRAEDSLEIERLIKGSDMLKRLDFQALVDTAAQDVAGRGTRHFLSNGDIPTPLLAHYPDFNVQSYLALHRALALAEVWRGALGDVDHLRQAVLNLEFVEDGVFLQACKTGVARIIVELLRPLFRAAVVGWDVEVIEFAREEVEGGVWEDGDWWCGLCEVMKQCLELCGGEAGTKEGEEEGCASTLLLAGIALNVGRERVTKKAVSLHLGAVIGIQLQVQMQLLERAVGEREGGGFDFEGMADLMPQGHNVNEMFLTHSLREKWAGEGRGGELTQFQIDFLHRNIDSSFGGSQGGGTLPVASLGVFVGLGQHWGVSKATISSLYVVGMWWAGKDLEVADLLSNIPASVFDASLIVKKGVRIVCWRIAEVLKEFKKMKNRGEIYGRLDADMTVYVKEVARKVEVNKEGGKERKGASLVVIHELGLTLLRFAQLLRKGEEEEEEEGLEVEGADKVHGITVLTGTLVQALKQLN